MSASQDGNELHTIQKLHLLLGQVLTHRKITAYLFSPLTPWYHIHEMLNLKNHTILADWNSHKCSTPWLPGGAFRRASRGSEGFSVSFDKDTRPPALFYNPQRSHIRQLQHQERSTVKLHAWGFATQIPIRAVNQRKFLLCSVQRKGVDKRPCHHKLRSSKALLFLQWKTRRAF